MITTITVRRQCERCEGTGQVQSEYWRAFHNRHPEGGLGAAARYFEAVGVWRSGQGLPSEEVPCPDCEGRGEQDEEIDLDGLA